VEIEDEERKEGQALMKRELVICARLANCICSCQSGGVENEYEEARSPRSI
jgi:hypothetical protein